MTKTKPEIVIEKQGRENVCIESSDSSSDSTSTGSEISESGDEEFQQRNINTTKIF